MQEVQSVAYNAYLYSLLSPESYEGRNSGNTWVEPSLATLYNEPDDQRAQLIVKDVLRGRNLIIALNFRQIIILSGQLSVWQKCIL